MYPTIYKKLVWYFSGLILVTCLATGALFYLTLGRPIAREGHQLIRNHVRFIAEQAADILTRGENIFALEALIASVTKGGRMTASILDSQFQQIAGSPESSEHHPAIRGHMIEAVRETGVFVQSGHMSDRTVYLVPVTGAASQSYYLYMSRERAAPGALLWFLSGLGAVCLLLIAGIYPLANNFTRPIQRLSRIAEEIAQGRLEPAEVPLVRQDELGTLEAAFMRMAGSVREMVASKKQLLADISHELRSPLGRMAVSLEMLYETVGDEETPKRHVRMLESEVRFMEGMVRDLSAYSKINLPEFRLSLSRVASRDLLTAVFTQNQPIMDKAGVRFRLQADGNLPEIKIDETRITSVLQNLLDNARQVCPKQGEIVLGGAISGNCLRFFVSDTGKGLSEADAERIFQPLFRTDASRNRRTGGLGLGLAISRRIVAHHGGRIWCCRETDRTFFNVELTI